MAVSQFIQAVKDEARGRPRSTSWYRDKIKEFGKPGALDLIRDGKRANAPFYGRLNMFFYDPKHKKKLPYYDMFPIVLPFEKHKNGFTGINFHYLPIYMRIKLLELLDAGYGDEDKGRLQVFWHDLKELKLARPIVRRYLAPNVKSLFLHIPKVVLAIGIVLSR